MKYGYFDNENREYVITNPATPAPWVNYLGSPEYGAIISNNAGGYSFAKSGANGRILRRRGVPVAIDNAAPRRKRVGEIVGDDCQRSIVLVLGGDRMGGDGEHVAAAKQRRGDKQRRGLDEAGRERGMVADEFLLDDYA